MKLFEQNLWGIYSHVYDGLLAFWPYQNLLQLVLSNADIHAGECILDLGCGTGNFLNSAYKSKSEITATGVDLSSAMLRAAHRKLAQRIDDNVLDLVNEDIMTFLGAQPDKKFDHIISINVLYTIRDQEGLWRELLRTLKPGGKITVTTSVRTGSLPIIKEHLRHKPFISLLRPKLVAVFFIDALINLMGHTGKFAFADEGQLRGAVNSAGGKWGASQLCYGGSTEGVNILFSVSQ
jgi:ubiquinone/menaquinone biosynthesis C-methylase UbiE